MIENKAILPTRREFLFLYDIKMGNPNGDPDENRPRILPDGTYYVTDVRLKRFCRDFMKSRGEDILVDNIEGRTTNLTGRVVHYLNKNNLPKAEGAEIVQILLDSFIDARLFGSSFAFKGEKTKKTITWKPKPEPKTMTGAVQINMGEILHQAESVDIHGTTTFGSDEEKGAGTFTAFYGLRYGLIGFSGVANQHSAQISQLTGADYQFFLKSLWHGVRSAANTRSKVGQIPHLLIDIEYKQGVEYQFGRLHDYVQLVPKNAKEEKAWSKTSDYQINLSKLVDRIQTQAQHIEKVRYAQSLDVQLVETLPSEWAELKIEELPKGADSK